MANLPKINSRLSSKTRQPTMGITLATWRFLKLLIYLDNLRQNLSKVVTFSTIEQNAS